MRNMMSRAMWIGLTLAVASSMSAAAENVLFEADFENAEVGSEPENLMNLGGDFTVREEDGNRFLELPGAPLDTFGFLFGPPSQSDFEVSLRAFSTRKGRRLPAFAVGSNGWESFRLQVSALKRSVELYKGKETVASAPYEWESGKWTRLLLRIESSRDGGCVVSGKVWRDAKPEPKEWLIRWNDSETPRAGQASAVASPFSGQAIRFDDLRVEALPDS